MIKTFVVNLEERTERRTHIISQFQGRSEFDLTIVKAVKHRLGSWGLWKTIKSIIQNAFDQNENYIILCEDDHCFTNDYNKKEFFEQISKLEEAEADILLGGASWFGTVLPISRNLFWVKHFNGLQFTVIFKKFYTCLLDLDLYCGEDPDIKISELSNNCFICYPYISVQKEFGYSDITPQNAQEGYVTSIFNKRSEKLMELYKVALYYNKI